MLEWLRSVNFLLFYLNHTKVLTCISCLQMCNTHWSLAKNCFSLPKREILLLLFLSSGSQPSMILFPGNIQQCLEMVFHNWEGGVEGYWHSVGRVQGCQYTPTVHMTPPTTTTKNHLIQNGNSATIEKPCS